MAINYTTFIANPLPGMKADSGHLLALALSGSLEPEQTKEVVRQAMGIPAPGDGSFPSPLGPTISDLQASGQLITPAKPYACWCHPRPVAGAVTHRAQDGYQPNNPEHMPRMVDVIHTMSTDCRYDKRATDPRCAGCPHIKVP